MTDPNQFVKRLSDSESLTDVLIQCEDWFDSLDLYVFKNWFEGEIVDGPNVERYWVSVTLMYDYEQMPDPSGGARLLKYGAKVTYELQEIEDTEIKRDFDARQLMAQTSDTKQASKEETPTKKVWMVEITIPRHFIEELDDDDLSLHSDDAEDVSDARDGDLEDEDAYTDADEGVGGEAVADASEDADSEEEQA